MRATDEYCRHFQRHCELTAAGQGEGVEANIVQDLMVRAWKQMSEDEIAEVKRLASLGKLI
ncbi:hypothetical protein, partial [Lactococcus petauri]|uniref:hypothetical protein n=1 Tax=Lactococcus petauri TaxID=1940789 RepID=UPI0021F16112